MSPVLTKVLDGGSFADEVGAIAGLNQRLLPPFLGLLEETPETIDAFVNVIAADVKDWVATISKTALSADPTYKITGRRRDLTMQNLVTVLRESEEVIIRVLNRKGVLAILSHHRQI